MENLEKKPNITPEGYSPNKPIILKMIEDIVTMQTIEKITIKDVTFEIIRKPKTIYAGIYGEAPDCNSEPDLNTLRSTFIAHIGEIKESLTPDCIACLSIDYWHWGRNNMKSFPPAFMFAQESSSMIQPECINTFIMPESLFVKVKADEAAWKLAGEQNPGHLAPIFNVIKKYICTSEYGYREQPGRSTPYRSERPHEMEYYYSDCAYAYVPVERI